MPILIRPALPKDAPHILGLIRELALYEKAPEAVWNTEAEILEEGFGAHPYFFAFVAETEDGEIVGMAVYHWAYSTWKGKYMFLDDLYVKEKMRGKGVGKLLLDAFIADARERGANLVKWQVLDWNEPAINFYKKYDVLMDSEWIDCKIIFREPYEGMGY